MPGVEVNLENGKNLWSNLLQEVKEKSLKTANIPTSLLVLGNEGSGKSSLIARLQKSDIKHGVGLEFDYIEIKDESIDENKKLNIWISSGDTYHTNLLKYALNETNFGYTICLITVSLSEPWNLIDRLEEWLQILKMHIDRLKLNPTDIQFLKESLTRQFQEYCEPDLEIEKQVVVGKRRDTDFNYLHPSVIDDPDKILIPLEEGIFEKNLGIPIVVVITKTDSIFTLEQDFDYNDDKFDFIQMHLRKICLRYGAALCYTSLKDDRNCDLLLTYILHRCYGFSMINNASVIEKDAIFVPSGWDNNKKINILSENILDDIKNQSYSSIINKPLSLVRANAQNRLTEPEVAEDEQVFLIKQQALIQRIKAMGSTDGNARDNTSRSGSAMNQPTASRNRRNVTNITNSPANASSGSSQQANEGVLANFFSSLLNKRGVSTDPTLSNQQSNVNDLIHCDTISEIGESQKDEILLNSTSSNMISTDVTETILEENYEIENQGKMSSAYFNKTTDFVQNIENYENSVTEIIESENIFSEETKLSKVTNADISNECVTMDDENIEDVELGKNNSSISVIESENIFSEETKLSKVINDISNECATMDDGNIEDVELGKNNSSISVIESENIFLEETKLSKVTNADISNECVTMDGGNIEDVELGKNNSSISFIESENIFSEETKLSKVINDISNECVTMDDGNIEDVELGKNNGSISETSFNNDNPCINLENNENLITKSDNYEYDVKLEDLESNSQTDLKILENLIETNISEDVSKIENELNVNNILHEQVIESDTFISFGQDDIDNQQIENKSDLQIVTDNPESNADKFNNLKEDEINFDDETNLNVELINKTDICVETDIQNNENVFLESSPSNVIEKEYFQEMETSQSDFQDIEEMKCIENINLDEVSLNEIETIETQTSEDNEMHNNIEINKEILIENSEKSFTEAENLKTTNISNSEENSDEKLDHDLSSFTCQDSSNEITTMEKSITESSEYTEIKNEMEITLNKEVLDQDSVEEFTESENLQTTNISNDTSNSNEKLKIENDPTSDNDKTNSILDRTILEDSTILNPEGGLLT